MVVLDRATKEKMAGRVRFFKEHWTSPKDPNYALLELKIDRLEYLRPGEMLAEKCVM